MHNVFIFNMEKDKEGSRVIKTQIHDSSKDNTSAKITGTISEEVNAINSVEFIIYYDNPGYELLQPYSTRVEIRDRDTGEPEFFGRVLKATPELSSNGMVSKKVVCEGFLGFLHDDCVEMKMYSDYDMNIINGLLDKYNKSHSDTFTFSYDVANLVSRKLELAGEGESIYDFIVNKFMPEMGAEITYFAHYSDEYYRNFIISIVPVNYHSVCYDAITIGENLISYSCDEDISSMCTRVIPYGAKIYTDEDNLERVDITSCARGGVNYIAVDASAYGNITKTVLFDAIEDSEELYKEGVKYLEEHSAPQKTYQITAIDKHLLDVSYPKLKLGNWYEVNAPIVGAEKLLLRITKKSMSIENPAKDTFTVGDNLTLTGSQESSTAATVAEVKGVSDSLNQFWKIAAKEITALRVQAQEIIAKQITTETLSAAVANINSLTAEDAVIKNISTLVLDADTIRAATANFGYLTAEQADVLYLTVSRADATYLTANTAKMQFATIDMANVKHGSIGTALIETGAVGSAQIADGSITSAKIVELTANKITTGTLAVERLLLTGSDKSVVYALNNSGELVSKNVDTLDGAFLTERSITADKIVAASITSKEIAAQAITTNHLTANAVTSTKIDVTELIGSEAFISQLGSNKIIVGIKEDATSAKSTASTAQTTANNAKTAADTAQNTATNAQTTANAAKTSVNNLYTTNTTTIDGGKITTGSIKASSIDVANLFAQAITATGSITGATIVTNKGTIGGWSLSANGIYKTLTSINDITNTGIFMSPTSGIRMNNISDGGLFIQNTANSRVYTCTARGNYIDFSNDKSEGYKAIIGCDASYIPRFVLTNSSNVVVTEIKPTTATLGGSVYVGSNLYIQNGKDIIFRDTDGSDRSMLAYDKNNNVLVGYGCKLKGSGQATLYGQHVRMFTSVDASFASDAANGHFYPSITNKHRLGSSNYKWQYVYATNGTIQTSDIRQKENIRQISEKYEHLFMLMKPVSYSWKNNAPEDNHDRTRLGFIAQWTKKAMEKVGLSDTDVAAYCRDAVYPTVIGADGVEVEDRSRSPVDYIYGINYTEFVALNTHMIQKMYNNQERMYCKVIVPLKARIIQMEVENKRIWDALHSLQIKCAVN